MTKVKMELALREACLLLHEVRPCGDSDWQLGKEIDAFLKEVRYKLPSTRAAEEAV